MWLCGSVGVCRNRRGVGGGLCCVRQIKESLAYVAFDTKIEQTLAKETTVGVGVLVCVWMEGGGGRGHYRII